MNRDDQTAVELFVAKGSDGFYIVARNLPAQAILGGPYGNRRAAVKEARQLSFSPFTGKLRDTAGRP